MTAQVLIEKKKLRKTAPNNTHIRRSRPAAASQARQKRRCRNSAASQRNAANHVQCRWHRSGGPQVGVNKQVIVLDCEPDNPETPPLVLINPTIKSSSSDVCILQEGCLSIPGVYLEVKRPEVIEVSYRDEYGRPQTLIATELLSRAIQHEMDHLNGVLFVDRVENKLALTEELVKHKFSPKAVKSV